MNQSNSLRANNVPSTTSQSLQPTAITPRIGPPMRSSPTRHAIDGRSVDAGSRARDARTAAAGLLGRSTSSLVPGLGTQLSGTVRPPPVYSPTMAQPVRYSYGTESQMALSMCADFLNKNLLPRPSTPCPVVSSGQTLSSGPPPVYAMQRQNLFGPAISRTPSPASTSSSTSPLVRNPSPLNTTNIGAVPNKTLQEHIQVRPRTTVAVPDFAAGQRATSMDFRLPTATFALPPTVTFQTGPRLTSIQPSSYPSFATLPPNTTVEPLPPNRSSTQLPLLPRPAATEETVSTPTAQPLKAIAPAKTGFLNGERASSASLATVDLNGLDSFGPNSVLWGRVAHLPDGAIHFPGLGRWSLSSPQSILRRVLDSALASDGLPLQLLPSALEFDVPRQACTNNWLDQTSSLLGSRKGFHVCLCCNQSFTSQTLFHSHMLRPVACLFYRCHLCRGSDTSHNQSAVSDSPPRPTGSPYCTMLPDGVIQSTNRCALYSHFAVAHPEARADWTIRPALLAVCPLPESSWKPVGSETTPSSTTTTATRVEPGLESVGQSDARPNGDSLVLKPHSADLPPDISTSGKDQLSVFYRPGMELTEVWREFQSVVTETVPHHSLSVMSTTSHSIDYGLLNTCFADHHSFPTTELHMSMPHQSSMRRLTANSVESDGPAVCLPPVDSPLSQTILHYARADPWQAHVFLTDWCQTPHPAVDQTNDSRTVMDCEQLPDSVEDAADSGSTVNSLEQPKLGPTRPLVAPAPLLHTELAQSLDLLSTFRHRRSTFVFGSGGSDWTNLSGSLTSSNSDPTVHDSTRQSPDMVTPPPTQHGLLRCLLCSYRSNDTQGLAVHLCGTRPLVTTKCALCSHPICVRQPNLCAVKAHLLLHLGCYVMCPECGFTPPAFLAPDAAELCLRIHLRFVCFHYNLLQVYVCTQCQGHGKAFNSLTHFGQHVLDNHVSRTYACLWCARAPNTVQSTGIANRATAAAEPAAAATTTTDEMTSNGLDNSPGSFSHCFPTPAKLLAHMHLAHRQHVLLSPSTTRTGDQTAMWNSTAPSTPPPGRSQATQSSSRQDQDTIGDLPVSEKVSDSLMHLVPAVDFLCGYPCPECNEVFDRKDAFVQHLSTTHSTSHTRVSCYRCFGSCKRLSFDLIEFRQHVVSCPSALQMYRTTFAMTKESRCLPELTRHQLSLPVSENPLCFCSYCGIGSRRSLSTSGWESAGVGDGSVVDSQADDVGSVTEAAEPSPPPPTGNSSSLLVTDGASKELHYHARYFSDLRALHTHENQTHFVQNNQLIACPWCGHRLSCLNKHDIRRTIEHLNLHVKNHTYAAWQAERKRRWNRKARDLPHCFCGSALLDSPLAVISHCSSHLLVSAFAKTSPSSGPTVVPSTTADTLDSCVQSGTLRVPATTGSVHSSLRPASFLPQLPKPSPTAHIPCPIDVYRHLRFALHCELDHYLDQALLVRRPFVCPVCHCPSSTRWALCEHAFTEHWGTMCFICCLYIVPVPEASIAPCEPNNQPSDSPTPGPSTDPSQTTTKSDTAMDSPRPNSVAPSSAPGPVIPPKTPSPLNFWDHVFQCMTERSRLIRAAMETPVRTKPEPVAETGPANPDTYQAILNWRLRRSNGGDAVCAAADEEEDTTNGASVTHSTPPSPIVIPSSPEGLDHHPLSPYSGSSSTTQRLAGGSESLTLIVSKIPARRKRRRASDSNGKDAVHAKVTYSVVNSQHRQNYVREETDSVVSSTSSGATVVAVDSRGFHEEPTRPEDGPQSVSDNSKPDELLSCVLCGAQISADLWEEHSLLHRNPQMPWRGVALHEPQRIVLRPQQQPKVYKCHICERRFVTRFGCQRHLAGRHKIPKTRIDLNVLVETYTGEKPVSTSAAAAAASTFITTASLLSSGGSSRSRPPNSTPNSTGSTTPIARQVVDPGLDLDGRPMFYCTICHIPFLSERTMTVHRSAAHPTNLSSG